MPDNNWDWSWHEGTTLGFHLTINPQPALPPSAAIYRKFVDHGIVVTGKELDSILAGREQGVQTISGILKTTAPGLGPTLNLKLSNTLADALLDKSLSAQLSRENPNTADRLERQADTFKRIASQASPRQENTGFLPQLLNSLPPVGVGFSVKIHF